MIEYQKKLSETSSEGLEMNETVHAVSLIKNCQLPVKSIRIR